MLTTKADRLLTNKDIVVMVDKNSIISLVPDGVLVAAKWSTFDFYSNIVRVLKQANFWIWTIPMHDKDAQYSFFYDFLRHSWLMVWRGKYIYHLLFSSFAFLDSLW